MLVLHRGSLWLNSLSDVTYLSDSCFNPTVGESYKVVLVLQIDICSEMKAEDSFHIPQGRMILLVKRQVRMSRTEETQVL